jgi:integrase
VATRPTFSPSSSPLLRPDPSIRRTFDSLPKVRAFLHSIGRNSLRTRKNYETGLVHLHKFLSTKYANDYSLETILKELKDNQLDVYELIDNFITYEVSKEGLQKLTPQTIMAHLIGIKSYLAYYDVDIIPSKFKRKVKLPREAREDEEPLDVQDIRRILLACNNRRLKTYILVLASSGLRAIEGLSLRLRDCDYSVTPTKIHVRKEYSKTRVARTAYISDEATNYLNEWLAWKYRDKGDERWTKKRNEDDLIFSVYTTSNQSNPAHLYIKMVREFQKVLSSAGLDERKESMKRRKITLHTLRRFTKTVISNQAGQDFSEMILGHKKSVYYTLREPERREIYATKCMKYLTFLDYTTLEATGKNIEAKLSEREKELQLLRQKDSVNTDAIQNLSDQLIKVIAEVQELKNRSY